MTQIFNAKTVEEARALAAKAYGVSESEITFEVLEEPKKTLFGLLSTGEARVRATYRAAGNEEIVPPVVDYGEVKEDGSPALEADAPAEEAAKEEAPAEEEAPVEEAPVEEAPAETVETEEVAASEEEVSEVVDVEEYTEVSNAQIAEEIAAAEEKAAAQETAPAEAQEKAAEEAAPEKKPMQQDEDLITGEPSEAALEKIERAKNYLASILGAMGVEAEFVVKAGAESAMIDIVAPNNGAVIGKRGETLDALQYLTFMIANRGDKEYYRIILNSAGYRERRRKTLEELAGKIARNVLKNGRMTKLEPMNPYERRIIHSAIAEIEGVSSRSEGEEPYRRVVISSNNRPQHRRRNDRDGGNRSDRRGGGRPDRRGGRRNDRRDRRSDAPPQRMSMDSMKTSFERDYKRPKEDDDINTGLYGKIEF